MLHPALLGLFTLADLRVTGTLAQGERMRFYAEAACYPTALLPSQGVRWTLVSESSGRATGDDGGVAAAARRGRAQALLAGNHDGVALRVRANAALVFFGSSARGY